MTTPRSSSPLAPPCLSDAEDNNSTPATAAPRGVRVVYRTLTVRTGVQAGRADIGDGLAIVEPIIIHPPRHGGIHH